MSSRKRPLAELSQAQASMTPSRYAPSTPHAIRALQERSSAKRSARSARTISRTLRNGNISLDLVRPDGSARNILKQFAKITAPVTRKRISTPIHVDQNKENSNPDGEDDSLIGKRPNFTFNIEESIEEEDSELPIAPTPSVLLNDSDDDTEQPTVTFQNIESLREMRAMSERVDRRKSGLSMIGVEVDNLGDDQDVDATIMTERGRRALSEEATGRLSRYSFGSIRMSEFGSELEIRRDSDRQQKLAELEGDEDDYYMHGQDDTTELYDNDTLRKIPHSPTDLLDESVQFQGLGDDTFSFPVPDDQHTDVFASAEQVPAHANMMPSKSLHQTEAVDGVGDDEPQILEELEDMLTRKQTHLEAAATKAQTTRPKRMKLTRHGTEVPCLPTSLVKRTAIEVQTRQGKRKPKFGKDHIKALEQATEWFFEQIGEDLAAYSSHGRRRKRIDIDDALLLMKRQRMLSMNGDLHKLAVDWLPKDVVEDLGLDGEH